MHTRTSGSASWGKRASLRLLMRVRLLRNYHDRLHLSCDFTKPIHSRSLSLSPKLHLHEVCFRWGPTPIWGRYWARNTLINSETSFGSSSTLNYHRKHFKVSHSPVLTYAQTHTHTCKHESRERRDWSEYDLLAHIHTQLPNYCDGFVTVSDI